MYDNAERKKTHGNEIRLPNSETINDLREHAYRYLGLLEGDEIKCTETKNSRISERKLKNPFEKKKLNSGNLTKSINAWAFTTLG